MIYFSAKLKLHSPVISIGCASDGILFVDSDYRIYKTSSSLKEFLYNKALFKNTDSHHEYSKAVDCFNNFISMPKSHNRIDTIYKLTDKIEIISRLTWHKSYVSVSRFSPDNRFVATGGEDGRVYVYNKRDYKIYAIMPPRPDYISNIVFSSRSKYIAYHSHEPKSIIYRLDTNEVLAEFATSDKVEDSVFFENDTKLVFVCKNGNVGIYNLLTNELDLQPSYKCWLTSVTLSMDSNYAYIGAKSNLFYVHDLNTNRPFLNFSIESNATSIIRAIDDKVLFGCPDGSVLILDPNKHIEEFTKVCKSGNLKKAYDFADANNPLLKTLKVYKNLKESLWDEAIDKATNLISRGNLKDAINLMQPFLEDSILDSKFKEILESQALIREALKKLAQKDYTKVYAIVNSTENMRELGFFKDLEHFYKREYDLASATLERDPWLNLQKAKQILEPFANIPEKATEINRLLNNASNFTVANNLAREQKFKELFSLADTYEFLKDGKAYKLAFMACNKLYDKALHDVYNADLKQTGYLTILKYLSTLSPFTNMANDLLKIASLRLEIIKMIAKSDYKGCYKLMEDHPEVYTTKEAAELEKKVDAILTSCKDIAYQGKTLVVYNKISMLFDIKKLAPRIASIMKIAYLYEIENAKAAEYNKIDWIATFTNYIRIFGRDNELICLCNDEALRSVINFIHEKKTQKIEYIKEMVVYLEDEGRNERTY
ncbi:WD40 repeat domain-containing protein [Helicobacter sp. 11S02629-2]|uniref:WD40 repeat domain-containing protein n=1 Tax=Helicobacter sp. 11S02629-2 TaxID=1476195 RepID=UPI000BA77DB0|nr:WD40 repeat domain-containing protein [Helicobacter sp. 11S02629-2]PAF44907.1 hypothetical protein BKH40_04260 [Helicobacter sp. 11S02629-2]